MCDSSISPDCDLLLLSRELDCMASHAHAVILIPYIGANTDHFVARSSPRSPSSLEVFIRALRGRPQWPCREPLIAGRWRATCWRRYDCNPVTPALLGEGARPAPRAAWAEAGRPEGGGVVDAVGQGPARGPLLGPRRSASARGRPGAGRTSKFEPRGSRFGGSWPSGALLVATAAPGARN